MQKKARKKKRRDQGQPCPKRGRRYNQKQRRAVLAWEARHGVEAAVEKFGVSARIVQGWHDRYPDDVKAVTKKSKQKVPTSKWGSARSSNAAKRPRSQPQKKKDAARRARHAKRFSAAEKKVILEAADADGVTAAAKAHNTSRYSIYEWRRRLKGAKTKQDKARALAPRSSNPRRNARKLSEERYHLIGETWLKNQALGPRQVRNKLHRDHAVRVGTSTARKVMEEHGYVPPRVTVERRDVRRYEAVRPNQQVHLDFLHFFVHKAKVFLLLIEDDYSRFITAAARAAEVLALQVRNAVLEYRVEHPGAWVCGGRTTYTKDLVAFIVELATRSIGPSMTQADFADACGIPLPTLKDWWANAARQLALPLAPAPPDAPSESTPPPASEPEPLPSPPELELGPSPELVPDPEPPPSSPAASDPADAGTLGLSADMLRIVAEYETWHGALPAFVDHLRSLGLRYGRQMVTQILCPQRRCRTFPPVPVPGECPEQRNQPNATSHLSAADGWNVLDTRR